MPPIVVNLAASLLSRATCAGCLLSLPWLLSACLGTAHVGSVPQPPLPDTFSHVHLNAHNAPERWWSLLDDPDLDGVIAAALDDNLDLRTYWERLLQAEATLDQAASARWPSLDAQASVGRAHSGGARGAVTQNNFQVSAAASYEVDLWGKVAAQIAAAELEREAVADMAHAAAMTLVAQVTEAWLDVRYQRARRALRQQQIDIASTYLDLVRLRFAMGQASALDVLQQQQQLESLQSQLVPVDTQDFLARLRLAVLLGRAQAIDVPAHLDQLPLPDPALHLGAPQDLLQHRPELRAARRRVEAADARIIVAMADRLPTLRLSASLMLAATAPLDLLDQLFWSLGATLGGPVFDGGRRAAELSRTHSVWRERVYAYAHAILVALEEVERSHALCEVQRQLLDDLDLQLNTASLALHMAREQFLGGITDYSRVITALAALQQLQLSRLDIHRQYLSYWVQRFRALGGAWVPPRPDLEAHPMTLSRGQGAP